MSDSAAIAAGELVKLLDDESSEPTTVSPT
jgi:hypothetical protein